MAEIARKHPELMSMINGIKEEKWAKHYSSNHQILLVGEGDFSFALSLAMSFGSASNIVASSLDSYEVLIQNYKRAKTNLEILQSFGAQILHQVDATKLKIHIRNRKFDRIIYNFPHAGFLGNESDHSVIKMHRKLVHGFLMNASGMLLPKGEVHVSHKTAHPFDLWNIQGLATQSGLTLVECVEFKLGDYPGYNNKRGAGLYPDKPFPIGKCSTFKFIASSKAIKSTSLHHVTPQQPLQIPSQRMNLVLAMILIVFSFFFIWIIF